MALLGQMLKFVNSKSDCSTKKIVNAAAGNQKDISVIAKLFYQSHNDGNVVLREWLVAQPAKFPTPCWMEWTFSENTTIAGMKRFGATLGKSVGCFVHWGENSSEEFPVMLTLMPVSERVVRREINPYWAALPLGMDGHPGGAVAIAYDPAICSGLDRNNLPTYLPYLLGPVFAWLDMANNEKMTYLS